MWRYRDQPIQRKISLIVVIGMICAMVVTVGNFISFDRDNVKRDLGEEMRVLARITAARSAVAVAFNDRGNALENLNTLALRSTIQHACIYDFEQNLFAQFQRAKSEFSGCTAVLAPVEMDAADNNKLLIVVEPIMRRDQLLGHVLIASDLSPIAERTRKWVVTSFFVTLVALLVAFVMTHRLQMSVVRPIVHLANLMDRVKQQNNLELRASVHSQDEVGHLVLSFNDMLQMLQRHQQDLEMLYQGLVDKSTEAEATAASLEVSNQRIKDLFGSAAHDLRQPLQAINIFAETLRKRVHDPDALDILRKLKLGLNNLTELFNEILDASRYDFDLMAVGTRPISIRQLLSKVYLEFEVLAAEKNLTLRFHTPDYRVVAHAALLERIIRNLLSNAIRYTDQGGVLLGCRRRGAQLSIEVWDTGRGIPEEQQEQIFSRYVQVTDEDHQHRGGYGLGLAIVKQFVDSLGYDLSVSSRVGVGTCFRLLLPLEDTGRSPLRPASSGVSPPTQSAPLQLETLHNDGETHVFLVDDSESVRQALAMILRGWGFSVYEFASLESVQSYCKNATVMPDLVISDYQLGNDATGDQAIGSVRELLGRHVPAFIISGAEQPEVLQALRATGFELLRKPVKPARLRAMINHLIS